MLTNIQDIWQKYTVENLKQNVLLLNPPAACCYTTLWKIMLSVLSAFQ